jgi:hypothetical protein
MRILALWLYMKKTSLKILVASYDTSTEQPRTLLCRHGAWVPRDPNTQRGICSAGPIPLPGPGPGPAAARPSVNRRLQRMRAVHPASRPPAALLRVTAGHAVHRDPA